jgi:group I intron endonuclease
MQDALKRARSHIYRALLKDGLSNFSIEILEYCDKEKCIEREDYYLSSLSHEYNILEKAGSRLGSTQNNTGENNPMYGKNHSEETKTKISDAHKGKTLSDDTINKISEAQKGNTNKKGKPKTVGSGKPSLFFVLAIEVFDEKTNQTTTYNSISEAARALNIPLQSIFSYFINNRKKPYKGQYIFKKI